jgi:uncharacterized membrane protein YfcA
MGVMLIFSALVAATTLVSGIAGLGGGVLLLAALASFFPSGVLIPLHGSIQFMSNVSRVAVSPRSIDYSIVLPYFGGAVLGAAGGAALGLRFSLLNLNAVIGFAILVLTWLPRLVMLRDFRGKFLLVGFMDTFLSLFIGASGPLTAPFFLASKLTKDNFVPTKAACQVPVHFFKVCVYVWSGFAIMKWSRYVLLAVPMVMLGSIASKLLTSRVKESHFNLIVKVMITLLAAKMIVDYFLGS